MKFYVFFLLPSERRHQFTLKPVIFRFRIMRYAITLRLYWFLFVLKKRKILVKKSSN